MITVEYHTLRDVFNRNSQGCNRKGCQRPDDDLELHIEIRLLVLDGCVAR